MTNEQERTISVTLEITYVCNSNADSDTTDQTAIQGVIDAGNGIIGDILDNDTNKTRILLVKK